MTAMTSAMMAMVRVFIRTASGWLVDAGFAIPYPDPATGYSKGGGVEAAASGGG